MRSSTTGRTLRFLVDQVGADRVLYGSDYPFLIADPVGVRERVDALLASERDAILRGNAIRLFGLTLPETPHALARQPQTAIH